MHGVHLPPISFLRATNPYQLNNDPASFSQVLVLEILVGTSLRFLIFDVFTAPTVRVGPLSPIGSLGQFKAVSVCTVLTKGVSRRHKQTCMILSQLYNESTVKTVEDESN